MRNLAALSILPVFGWLMTAVMAVLFSIPLFFLWGWLGPIYFSFVPALYLKMGFWDMAGMVVLIGFIKMLALPSFGSTTKAS